MTPLRVAHRGIPPRARENTLEGFALALQAGADGIELDVHATSDGVVVVHHDPHLADGRELTRMTSREVELASAGYDIPTLDQVCSLVSGQAELFVEIKGAGIERAVAAVLDRYAGPAAIHSFDHALIARLHDARVAHRLGVLLDKGSSHDTDALMRQTGATDVWPHHSLVDRALVSRVHSAGGRVIVWTVNDLSVAMRLSLAGVDGLCTDDVAMLPR